MSLFTDLREVFTAYARRIKGLEAADKEIKADLGDVKEALILPTYKWTLRKNVDGVGNIVTSNYTALTDLIMCAGGDRINRTGAGNDHTYSLIYYINGMD